MKKAVLTLSLFVMIGCAGMPAPHPLSTDALNWNIEFSIGLGPHPQVAPDGLWFFNFPGNNEAVGYIMTDYVGTTPKQVSMTFRVDYTPDTVFNWSGKECPAGADVSLMLQKVNDDLQQEDGRWWAGTQQLEQGSGNVITVVVPVTPDRWSNVLGKFGTDRPKEFADTMANLAHVGMTFGGGCFYGHGVNISSGQAKFTLISYTMS